MAKIQILYLLLSTLIVEICHVAGCDCNGGPGHMQHEFCKSDFAAHVEILNKRRIHGQVEYAVYLLGEYRKGQKYATIKRNDSRVFSVREGLLVNLKARDVRRFQDDSLQRIRNGTTLHLTTPDSVKECGVPFLKRGKQYLIMGQIDQGLYWFDGCNYRSPWSIVDKPCQSDSLKFGEYLKNCKVCQVSFCSDQNNCYPPPSGRGCDDSGGENYRDVCEFDGYSACRWVKC